jgi:hypothetical protein
MATYKVIQDIEAEDHILGPLSFRQFVFGLIAVFMGYMCFLVITKHVAFLLIVFLPPTLFCGFFAFPWGGDQPTETWALAKLRFFFLPRRRVWNQSGIKELVTITVPKKVERIYTDGLSQGEVKSRLQALANTIDSRGWAIKHLDAVGYIPEPTSTERLIDIPDVPGEVSDAATPEDDIMDPVSNPVAQQFDSMIAKSNEDRRQRLIQEMNNPAPPVAAVPGNGAAAQWFTNHNPAATASQAFYPAPVEAVPASAQTPVTATAVPSAPDDALLDEQLKQQAAQSQVYSSHLRTLLPAAPADAATPPYGPVPQTPVDNPSPPMTASGDPAILSLSNNNDLNVATLAREAQRARDGGSQDEVVISLH